MAAKAEVAFKCEKCGQKRGTLTIDSRGCSTMNAIRRRKVCRNGKCKHRFTTYEITQTEYEKTIVRDRAFREWMSSLVAVVKIVGEN